MTMARQHTPPWRSDTSVPPVQRIAAAMEPTFGDIVFNDGFDGDVTAKGLKKYADIWLKPCIQLDPRGGHFTQGEMLLAIKHLAEQPQHKAYITTHAEKSMVFNSVLYNDMFSQWTDILVYRGRNLLANFKIRAKAWHKNKESNNELPVEPWL